MIIISTSTKFLLIAQLLAVGIIAASSTSNKKCENVPVDKVSRFAFDEDFSKYWECLNGATTIKHCRENHHFNQVTQTCLLLDNDKIYKDGLTCDPNSVDFFPHPTDCSKYIWCYYGIPYIIDCDDGQWFSPSEKRCVDPVSSGCTSTSEPPWTTPDNSICEDVPDGDILLKKCDCGCLYYWECRGKQQTLKLCEFKLYFVEERQLCAGLVNCNDNTRTPFPWTTTFPTTIVSRPDYNDPRCYGKDDVYLPHPDCTKFTHCEIGWGLVWNCPKDLYFNANELKCGPYSESTCADFSTLSLPADTTTNTPPFNGDPRCDPSGTLDLLPYPNDCNKYIECYGGNSYLLSCPNGQWFDAAKKICAEASETDCVASTTVATTDDIAKGYHDQRCVDNDGALFARANNCRKFYECFKGHSFERVCPSGLHFDHKDGRCIALKLSKCVFE